MFDEFLKSIRDELTQLREEIALLREEVRAEKAVSDNVSFDLATAAKLTGFAYGTLYKRCKSGDLNHVQQGARGTIIVTRADLIDFMRRNKVYPEAITSIGGKLKVTKR